MITKAPNVSVSIVDSIDRLVGLDGRFVADLGCGCGMLMSTIALAYQPAAVVGTFRDLDYRLNGQRPALVNPSMECRAFLLYGMSCINSRYRTNGPVMSNSPTSRGW